MENRQKGFSEPDDCAENKLKLKAFALLHMMNDIHSTALPTVVPMLVSSISLSLTQAGVLNGIFGISNIIGQPVFGYIADKLKRPWFAVWGPCLSAIGAYMLPLSPNFGFALVLVACMSVGTSLFHPQGNGLCGAVAGSKSLAFYLSLFMAFGCFGSAIGPLYIVYMIGLLGKNAFPVMLIPFIAFCSYIWLKIGKESKTLSSDNEKLSVVNFFKQFRRLFLLTADIVAMASIRDGAMQSIKLFIPMLVVARGGSIAQGGITLFFVTIASMAGGVIGGKTADIIGEDKMLFISVTLTPLLLIAALLTSGRFSIMIMMLGFALLQASSSSTTAMAQRRSPQSRSAVSSIAAGVSWGVANIIATPVGAAADIMGLEATLTAAACIPWIVTAMYAWRKFKKQPV